MRTVQASMMALLLLLLARSASGKEVAPPNAEDWDSKEGPPAWIAAPAPNADVVRGVVASQSNLLELASSVDAKWFARSVLSSIAWRLRPVLGEAADNVLAMTLPTTPTTRRAYHLTPARRGEMFPGAATHTVWFLWEIPVAPILEKIPANQKDAARKSLVASEPEGTPAWTVVKSAPAWAAATAATADVWTVTVEEAADRADVSRAESVALSEERVASSIAGPLRKLLGPEVAWDVGRRGATWRQLTHRASSTTGDRPPAWARFEVPLARILAAVPVAQREAARTAFGSSGTK